MADLEISNLPPADALSGSELIVVVQDSETRRSTVDDLPSATTSSNNAVAMAMIFGSF